MEFSSQELFEVNDKSQFGSGDAIVYENEGFLGTSFDTGRLSVGKIRKVYDPFFGTYLGSFRAKAEFQLQGASVSTMDCS